MAITAPSQQRGFTLVELITTVAIIAILLGIGAPSFSNMINSTRQRTAINDYWHAIYLARSEAIKRNSVVVICKSSDGRQCNDAAGNWAGGWLVFDNKDHDHPAQVDAGEPVLQLFKESGDIHITSKQPRFEFRPFAQGMVNGTIVFCDARGDAHARAIIISHTGRPRESNRDANRRALECTA